MYTYSIALNFTSISKTFALNNDINNIRVHLVEHELCGIKLECHFLGHPVLQNSYLNDMVFVYAVC